MSLLGGKKPTRQAASSYELELGREATGLHRAAGRYGEVTDRANWDLAAGRGGARADALGATSADVAIAAAQGGPATNANGVLDRAMMRGRGLSRLISAKSNEFDSQLLRDRAVAVGQGRQRQAMGLNMLSQSAKFDMGISNAMRGAKRIGDEAKSNTLGSIAGIGLGVFANRGTLFPQRIKGDPGGGMVSPSYNPMGGAGVMYS